MVNVETILIPVKSVKVSNQALIDFMNTDEVFLGRLNNNTIFGYLAYEGDCIRDACAILCNKLPIHIIEENEELYIKFKLIDTPGGRVLKEIYHILTSYGLYCYPMGIVDTETDTISYIRGFKICYAH